MRMRWFSVQETHVGRRACSKTTSRVIAHKNSTAISSKPCALYTKTNGGGHSPFYSKFLRTPSHKLALGAMTVSLSPGKLTPGTTLINIHNIMKRV